MSGRWWWWPRGPREWVKFSGFVVFCVIGFGCMIATVLGYGS